MLTSKRDTQSFQNNVPIVFSRQKYLTEVTATQERSLVRHEDAHEINVGNHDAKRGGFQLIDKMVSSLS